MKFSGAAPPQREPMWTRLLDLFRRKVPVTDPTFVPEIDRIDNRDLTEAGIPDVGAEWDSETMQRFAHSLWGYAYWGSFEKCVEIARKTRSISLDALTLTELRTGLFSSNVLVITAENRPLQAT
jgi:hypothetical protein